MKTADELIAELEKAGQDFDLEFVAVVRRMLDRETDTERFCKLRDDLAARGIIYEPLEACIDLDDVEDDDDGPNYPYPN